jgi:L-fuconolactonase
LAKRPNVWCKVSGGITEAQLDWTRESVRPYLDAVLEAFGPKRLMYGSNWPVSEAAGGCRKWLDAIVEWAAPLTEGEREWIFARAAREAYRLEGVR